MLAPAAHFVRPLSEEHCFRTLALGARYGRPPERQRLWRTYREGAPMGRHRKERPTWFSGTRARRVAKRAAGAVFTALVSYAVREGLNQALNHKDGPLSHEQHGADDR